MGCGLLPPIAGIDILLIVFVLLFQTIAPHYGD